MRGRERRTFGAFPSSAYARYPPLKRFVPAAPATLGSMSEPQNFYTVAQVARALQLHPTTIRRMIRGGQMQAVRFGRFWRIPANGAAL